MRKAGMWRHIIYKNSGETEKANDASSKYVLRKLRRDGDGKIRFHHHCNMCMRCSLYCPKDAIHIGFLESWGWKVNGGYDFRKIEKIEYDKPYITEDTKLCRYL